MMPIRRPRVSKMFRCWAASRIWSGTRLLSDKLLSAFGNNDVRRRDVAALRALGIRLVTIIHPQAVLSPSDEIGEDVTIMAGAIIGT